jgi:PhnB protein
MAARLNPYLMFDGNAREALEFYKDVFGGDLRISTFGEFGDPNAPEANLVMHAQLESTDGFVLMASDTPPGAQFVPAAGMSICVSGEGESEKLRGYWAKLAEGATVGTPLEKQVWGDEYGDMVDRFGTPWGFNVSDAG